MFTDADRAEYEDRRGEVKARITRPVYHTHGSRFGGKVTRTACGRHMDAVFFLKPPEWFLEHPYPDAVNPATCCDCARVMRGANR